MRGQVGQSSVCFKTCVIHALHLLEGNRFMQIYIFEFCVGFQFHFLFEFHIDFLSGNLINTLVVHVWHQSPGKL